MKYADKFKLKGQSILKDSQPNSMKDFLEGKAPKNAQIHKDATTQLHKTAESQKHNCTNTQSSHQDSNSAPEALERIHVQIRKELADKLIKMVYSRKRQGKKKATQRHIIEQALEEYFEKERI